MNQNGKYLLDTNILIVMLADDMIIHTPDEMQNAPKVSLPSPAIGELYYGARKSNRPIENLTKVNRLTQRFPLISCDLETAQWYGIIKERLRRKGRPIPNNDIWIAAIALQYDLILVTRDAHFYEVESLQTERW